VRGAIMREAGRMSPDLNKDPATAATTERHLALLGGWRRSGPAPAPQQALAVAVVGGAHLDYGSSAFPDGGTTVTVAAFVGGLEVIVPAGTRVELSGFSVLGRRRVEVAPQDDGPVLRVRAFTVVGGVHVHSA
jgi:hypothetical protein